MSTFAIDEVVAKAEKGAEMGKFKLKNGDPIFLKVSHDECKKFGGFLSSQRIQRKTIPFPKLDPPDAWELWEKARVLYKATVKGVANNPTATIEFFGRECLWIQIDGEEYVTSFPCTVVSSDDFENIGVVTI